jgi:acyl-coenzyme A synthetase/AMP-(fatty) acid ligase
VIHRQTFEPDTRWVDEHLLAGGDGGCLWLDGPVSRAELRGLVLQRTGELIDEGLRPGGSICLWLPPSLAYIVNLLAAWRVGAQVLLLDHRLTAYEGEQALREIAPQLLVTASIPDAGLRGFLTVSTTTTVRPEGRPARTDHVLLQLSSGSTGPSKVIGRTPKDLVAELDRYRHLAGTPQAGERVVLLASMVHVLGLVGGLMLCLNVGATVVVPAYLTTSAILDAVAHATQPTTILGLPFHADLLCAVDIPPALPHLVRMTVGGERVRPRTGQAFTDCYRVPLGVMYGMTEVGVVATDLSGDLRPALAPAPGMTLRLEAGQLLIATPRSPYVGATTPGRWVSGWLYTRDAGTIDPQTKHVTIHSRLDSQVSIAGLKVDLSEVEQTIAGLPGVVEVVVVFDGAIEAYVTLAAPADASLLTAGLTSRLAAYKRPQRVHLMPKLPRTPSGKLVRDHRQLRDARAAATRVVTA